MMGSREPSVGDSDRAGVIGFPPAGVEKGEMMDERKIAIASKLMRDRETPISEVCEAVGVSTATLYRSGSPTASRRSAAGGRAWADEAPGEGGEAARRTPGNGLARSAAASAIGPGMIVWERHRQGGAVRQSVWSEAERTGRRLLVHRSWGPAAGDLDEPGRLVRASAPTSASGRRSPPSTSRISTEGSPISSPLSASSRASCR